MAEPLVSQLLEKIDNARELYYRLILIVGPGGIGKTAALRELADSTSVPLINVNLELSRRMLELTRRQRALQLPRLFDEILGGTTEGLVLLDNIEILFDVHLKQDPLRLLQVISRNMTVVTAWNGTIVNGCLTYAIPGHPEYRRYPVHDFLLVSPEVTT